MSTSDLWMRTLVCSVQVHPRATGRDVCACVLIRGLSRCTPLQLIAAISNQQINLLPTSLWKEPAFSIFFVACNALCKQKSALCVIRKGQKLLKTVHF